jgi:hypothetical protein
VTGTHNPPLTLYDRSQVAQHNDDAHGHWLIIDACVYDVSELMRTHPGGARILQLYAGRDATHGFRRVHRDSDALSLPLARARIGALRELECSTHPDHAAHCAAARSLYSALALIVEMQNALRVDHAFQLLPLHSATEMPAAPRRSRYELQRGLETHARFHREYLDVLLGRSLIALASTILLPEAERAWREQVEYLQRSAAYTNTRAGVLTLLDSFESCTDQQLSVTVACSEVLDSWLLRMWKRELSRAVRALERPHAAGLQLGDAPNLYGVCDRLFEHLNEYFRQAHSVTQGSSLAITGSVIGS